MKSSGLCVDTQLQAKFGTIFSLWTSQSGEEELPLIM